MPSDLRNDNLITHTSIKEYFNDCVNDALKNQQIDAQLETTHYLVNLLTEFSRSEQLFEATETGYGIKPLAFTYAEAISSEAGTTERTRLLQKLGDTALFIAGIFADSFYRKLIDIDYYIAMGGNAYASVSDNMRNRSEAAQILFEELTGKFTDFVDVFGEVSERSNLSSNSDVLRLYEIWMRTGSRRAAKRLRFLGIEPITTSKPDFHH